MGLKLFISESIFLNQMTLLIFADITSHLLTDFTVHTNCRDNKLNLYFTYLKKKIQCHKYDAQHPPLIIKQEVEPRNYGSQHSVQLHYILYYHVDLSLKSNTVT